jgi:hypothetical protein
VREFVVFYAWQNDTPARENRYFIRTALGLAARRISGDPALDIHVKIDSDTQGVPGQPPVAATILAKIEKCDVFAPDFTFVAKTLRRKNKDGSKTQQKFLPNSNVMLKYGYALKAFDYSVMLPIMNTCFGPPNELPFDMRHLRFPLQYALEPGTPSLQRKFALERLAVELERILRDMIATGKRTQPEPFPQAETTRSPAFYFSATESLADFGQDEFERESYRFNFNKAAFLRLFPTFAQPPVGRAKLQQLFDARKIAPMSKAVTGLPARNRHGSVMIDPKARSEIIGLTQAFPTGELWGITLQPFGGERTGFDDEPKITYFVNVIVLEQVFQRWLSAYLRYAQKEFAFKPPFTFIAIAVGTLISERPPHRTVRAGFPHTAPTLGV